MLILERIWTTGPGQTRWRIKLIQYHFLNGPLLSALSFCAPSKRTPYKLAPGAARQAPYQCDFRQVPWWHEPSAVP